MKPSRAHVAGIVFGIILTILFLPFLVVNILGLVEGYGYHQDPIYFGNYTASITPSGHLDICQGTSAAVASIPFAGNVLAFMASGLGTILCIAVPILIFAIVELIRNIRLSKRMKQKYAPEDVPLQKAEPQKLLPPPAPLWVPEPVKKEEPSVDMEAIASLAAKYLQEEQEEQAQEKVTYMRRVSAKDIPKNNPNAYIIRKGKSS